MILGAEIEEFETKRARGEKPSAFFEYLMWTFENSLAALLKPQYSKWTELKKTDHAMG